MRTGACACVIVLLIGQGLAGAATISVFKDGGASATADLSGPEYTSVVEFRVPAECHITKATINISTVCRAPCDASPENVEVILDGTTLWSFNGPDYGGLGKQDRFLGKKRDAAFDYGSSGGSGNLTLRLPKKAVVTNATLDILCTGPMKRVPIANLSGDYDLDDFGRSVAGAGDVNGDGFDDVIAGLPGAGMARIYLGGKTINSTPDIILTGNPNDDFGISVSGAGDVNGDGYDDVIVGAPHNSTNGSFAGIAHVFFGGRNMDNVSDVVLCDGSAENHFGSSVSAAGDINGDGYSDVIVGTLHSGDRGKAFVYLGGNPMNPVFDLYMCGTSSSAKFGSCVSDAGDVNSDGYDDMIVGTDQEGRAYIYFGGSQLDNSSDIMLMEPGTNHFGCSVSDAGDVNGDGSDDVLVGADYTYFSGNPGRAFLYFGGRNMDSIADLKFFGENNDDRLGYAVSGLGDINDDGYDDFGIGAPRNTANGVNSGRAYIYFGGQNPTNTTNFTITGRAWDWFARTLSKAGDVNGNGYGSFVIGGDSQGWNGYVLVMDTIPGILDPVLKMGPVTVWNAVGYCNESCQTEDFSSAVNDYLASSLPSGNDSAGNRYVDLTLLVSGKDDGTIRLSNLSIIYEIVATTQDFTEVLREYQFRHKDQKDPEGNIIVPITIRSSTPGPVRLSALNVVADEAPVLIQAIPDFEMEEDTIISEPVDLHPYFKDDFDSTAQLRFNLVSVTNTSIVTVELMGNRYISVDAAEGDQNDNWTGIVEIVVNCTDRWGSMVESNLFRVVVTNVPDPPVFTSAPPLQGVGGTEYVYRPACEDGDAGDVLAFTLLKSPAGMTIDPVSGRVSWVPSSGGSYPVSISVSDGMFNVKQDFTITVPNRVPRLTNQTVPGAFVGEPYLYEIPAVDDDGDALRFVLLSSVPGMTVDERTGLLRWVPGQLGTFAVTVRIEDGKERLLLDFNIIVVQGNRAPRFQSVPVTTAIEGLPYSYNASAADQDGDVLTYSLVVPPEGMAVDPQKGSVSWTPAAAGKFPVVLKASDGRGGEDVQQFSVNVSERVRPKVVVVAPIEGQRASGKLAVTGRIVKGTLEVVKVQVRVDSGDWVDATGITDWQYRLDTSKLKDGKHTVQARAYDGMDYSETVNRTVTVSNKGGSGSGIPGFGAGLALMGLVLASLAHVWGRRRGAVGRAGGPGARPSGRRSATGRKSRWSGRRRIGGGADFRLRPGERSRSIGDFSHH
ncbi:MAG: hypothetical protein FJ149_10195 [Euryarchaeota archaeon]|nr:hypothetical protein [Euryarchaeota archaeon]